MFNDIPPYAFWSVWKYFSVSEKLFLVALFVLCVYSVFCLASTVSCLRKTRMPNNESSPKVAEQILAALQRRSSRLRKLIEAAFYVFGMVLFLGLQWGYVIADESRTPVGLLILQNFEATFVFGFNVFTVFLILHVIRWIVATSVDTFGVQLQAHEIVAPDSGRQA